MVRQADNRGEAAATPSGTPIWLTLEYREYRQADNRGEAAASTILNTNRVNTRQEGVQAGGEAGGHQGKGGSQHHPEHQ